MLWKVRWSLISLANGSVGRQSCPTPPGRSAGRPDPTRPWYVRVLDSTGFLNRISLVCASGEMFRRLVFDALESAGKDCSLGAQFYWRTVLPDPASPLRRAPRRDPPVVCSGFGFDRCLHRISLVRASGETLKRRYCDPLECTRDLRFLV